jgi:hypothetical protein
MGDFREQLADWTDVDAAQHLLAQCLGIFPLDASMIEKKSVYWSDNPLGDALYRILEALVSAGVIEKRDEPDLQYRWIID